MRTLPFLTRTITMKKLTCLSIIVATVITVLSACKEEVRVSRTVIDDVTDSTVTITYNAKQLVLDTRKSILQNGAVMKGDSAIVDFVGTGKKAKAVIISLIPKAGNIVSLEELRNDTANTLITIPVTSN